MRLQLLFFFIGIINLKSCVNTVLNCKEFDENANECTKCEDKHFLFYHNLFCIPCDDKDYGQIGCDGNCDNSKFENHRFAYCNKNECKPGFYYLEGLCLNCSLAFPGCKNCYSTEIQIADNQIDYNFTCQECLSNQYKKNEFGICQKCEMQNCIECIYTTDYSNKECLKCESNYYLSTEKTCKRCHENVYISHGYCTVCSDNLTDLESANCNCYGGYFLNKNNTCSPCSNDCSRCILLEDDSLYCLSCYSGYVLNNNKCLKCPENCGYCFLDYDNQTKCTSCYSNYALLNGKCIYCGQGCVDCFIGENNVPTCLSCNSYNYAFNPNKTCIYCKKINYLGNGCRKCQYNQIKDKYECLECDYYYRYYNDYSIKDSDYAYIINKFQCLYNQLSEQIYLYGCLEANFIDNNKYECLKCKEDFLLIMSDKICRKSSEINISNYCLEIINISDESNPIYSCNKCNNETTLITDSNNINTCRERFDNLAFCLTGQKYNNGKIICTKCLPLAHLNELNSKCECNNDSFGINNSFCYKCDDETKGSTGCLAKEGCEYFPAYEHLMCNKCKTNYFEFPKGQCIKCENEMEFCEKCHLDEDGQFFCDECKTNFIYNQYENSCQLNCKEYPEISPGCIICDDEYILKRKCQACRPGYYKTKNETCIYCRSEKYGGPACQKCTENETNGNIICASCKGKDRILNYKGKCHYFYDELNNKCEIFEYIWNEDEQKIICLFCKMGYYSDDKGNCVEFLQYLEKIENCYLNYYYIENIRISLYRHNYIYYSIYDQYIYIYLSDINDYNKTILKMVNDNLRKINNKIKGTCGSCLSGYFFDLNNNCIPIKVDNCSIISMLKNDLYYECQNLCIEENFPVVILNLNNNESSYITISEIYDKLTKSKILLNEIKSILNHTLCLNNSENYENNKLSNCVIAKYIEKEGKYLCHLCKYGNFLYEETNQCIKYDEKVNCEYENLGSRTNPIYSCKKCRPKNYYYDYYYDYFYKFQYNLYKDELDDSDYILVREGNINFCVSPESNLDNCLSATVDTSYINNKYNCTSCLINYLPYYSNYYQRYICQNILTEIKTSQNIDLDNYQYYSRIEAINGECPNNTFFTPDNKYCYQCDSYIGMPGCKSQCFFSLERNDTIKCLDGCKEGYIETSEGICKSCSDVNYGCSECHYEENTANYFGIKRKRKFICKYCYSDNYVLKDDKCIGCDTIENGCKNCEINNNEFKCIKCYSSYIMDKEGHCHYCDQGFVLNNTCIKCNDIYQGGIEGCDSCNIYENKISCYNCEDGYILLENNGTCLKISDNIELANHFQCSKIYLEDGKFNCLKCKNYRYSLLKENNVTRCIYLPEFNGYIDEDYFNFDELYYYENSPDIDYIYKYYFIRYINYNYFSHCVEVINLGSENNPLYSCIKCNDYNYLYTEENSNISYCIYYYQVDNYDDVQNCKEKKIKFIDKEVEFTCFSCEDNNFLFYDEINQVNYCKPYESNTEIIINDTIINTINLTKCMAKNCKQCKIDDKYFCEICEFENYVVNNTTGDCFENNDNIPFTSWKINEISTDMKICMAKNCKQCKIDDKYFCEICEFENYVVNNTTGDCFEKIEIFSSITWKDIYCFKIISEKDLNGNTIQVPKLNLRGETNSEINSGHTFIIYLIFIYLKQPLDMRNLQKIEDSLSIKAICEITKEVKANNEENNTVDYECIGENKEINLSYYILDDIDIENNVTSNLKQLVSMKNLSELNTGPTIEFTIDRIRNQTSNDYNFDFSMTGKIDDSNLKDLKIANEFEMNEIDKPTYFRFTIEGQKNATLKCKLNIKEYKNKKFITFNTTQIEYNNEFNISFVKSSIFNK